MRIFHKFQLTMNKRKKRFFTLDEIRNFIKNLETKTKRMPELIGFRSEDVCKNFKNLITMCNSLSIIFLQYNLIHETLSFLKKAAEADTALCKYGNLLDRLWQGRLVTYNNLAFLYHKVGQYKDCLKFLYEAQSLMVTIKEAGGISNCDIFIASNLLTFVALWKIRRYKEASGYLEKSAQMINSVIKGEKPSKLSKLCTQNLFGIVIMSHAGLSVKLEGSYDKAIGMLKDGLRNFSGEDVTVRALITDLIKELQKNRASTQSFLSEHSFDFKPEAIDFDKNSYIFPEINSDIFGKPVKKDKDWLVSKEFEHILFIATFLPFISPKTPLIRTSELEFEQSKTKIYVDTEDSDKNTDNNEDIPVSLTNIPRPYAQLMNNIVSKRKIPQPEVRFSSKISSGRGIKSTPRTRESERGVMRSWWDDSKFISKIKQATKEHSKTRLDTSKPRYQSEPRNAAKSGIPRPSTKNHGLPFLDTSIQDPTQRMMYFSPNVNFQRPSLKSRNLGTAREAKDQGKHIMIEFSPGRYREGESIPVELVPVPPKPKHEKKISIKPTLEQEKYASALDYMEDRENVSEYFIL
ncbi:unnamed protein product [Blepharisma stoltei]|uniref:Uncharacterized protein n=1 Tax=Blepharisma stoltei TaxID=1481888 RepID=A0AAU9JU26_9CILI|nr:unnamed protein product [Blepharisma stoltei]